MQITSIHSSIPHEESNNDRVFLRGFKTYITSKPKIDPYQGEFGAKHVVIVVLDRADDDFHLTFKNVDLGANQKEIIVSVTGCMTGYTNQSRFPSPFSNGIPGFDERKTITVKVAPNQKLVISDVPELWGAPMNSKSKK